MKFVMRPYHMVSLGGYIVEWLDVIPVTKDDNYLSMWKRAHAELDKVRPKNE